MSAVPKRNFKYEYEEEILNFPEEKKQDEKKVIKKKKHNRINIVALKYFCMVIVFFVVSATVIYNYAVITDMKMKANKLDEEISNYENKIDECNLFLENLNNTNMIEDMAKSYLGMNYPTGKQTVFLTINSNYNTLDEANDKENGIIDMIFGWFGL